MLRNLRDLFTGGEEVKKARSTAARLRAKMRDLQAAGRRARLEGAERHELATAEKVLKTRRRLLGVAGGVLGLAAIGGVRAVFGGSDNSKSTGVSGVSGQGDGAVPEQVSQDEMERLTDELIEKAERGFGNFAAILRPKIAALGDELLRREMDGPFQVLERNKANSEKNAYRFTRQNVEAGLADFARIEDINYFFYSAALAMGQGNLVAGFDPPTRKMHLMKDLDSDNLLDMLVLYHELRHAGHHANKRTAIHTDDERDAYIAFNQSNVDIVDEATAYAYEIEALNLLLDGRLPKIVTSWNGDTGSDLIIHVLQKLNARRDQAGIVVLLFELGQVYYPQGLSQGGFTKPFLDIIAKREREHGFTVVIKTENGQYQPY